MIGATPGQQRDLSREEEKVRHGPSPLRIARDVSRLDPDGWERWGRDEGRVSVLGL